MTVQQAQPLPTAVQPVSYTHLDVYKRQLLYKADPYASWSEMRPGNASRIADITGFKWGDAAWMKKRKETDPRRAALSIYEVHPGSWKKHPASEADPDGFYSYRELAHELADYVKRMGYTHEMCIRDRQCTSFLYLYQMV